MTTHDLMVTTYVQMLRNLSGCLTKAEAFCAEKGLDPAELVQARLAPDMFPLASQVLFSAIQAEATVARLSGRPSPPIPEPDQTFEAMQARIAAAIAVVEATPASDFEGCEARQISFPGRPGMVFEMNGEQFVRDWAIPQFYFHMITAYAIMRHKGVDLGKADYVTHAGVYRRMVEDTPT